MWGTGPSLAPVRATCASTLYVVIYITKSTFIKFYSLYIWFNLSDASQTPISPLNAGNQSELIWALNNISIHGIAIHIYQFNHHLLISLLAIILYYITCIQLPVISDSDIVCKQKLFIKRASIERLVKRAVIKQTNDNFWKCLHLSHP